MERNEEEVVQFGYKLHESEGLSHMKHCTMVQLSRKGVLAYEGLADTLHGWMPSHRVAAESEQR